MRDVDTSANRHGQTLDYGLHVHMIIQDTEPNAHEYATFMVSRLDNNLGWPIWARAPDSSSPGVSHQRSSARGRGSVRPRGVTSLDRHWTDPVQMQCRMFGSTDQILSEFEACKQMDVRSFISSGISHIDGCKALGARVMPELQT